MLWTEKYKPLRLKDIKGQDIERVCNFVLNYNREKYRALLLYGPTGTGKSLIANVIAKELGYEL